MRERTITVDINKNYHKSLNYKQYDNNNVLNIVIKEDGNLVDITNYTARAFYQLPSKTVIQRNTTKNGKNTIKLKIDKVILAESGRISLEVVINNIDTVVTTFTLFIDVEKSINRNEAIEGNPEWDIISDGLSGLDDVTNRTDMIENEIEDARDGETSLKARLDRDIVNPLEYYGSVEGSHISTDSLSGYAKDVEIHGNTIQDASNLADIRSVGEKIEGQELYEIPVLSYGKNLLSSDLLDGEYINNYRIGVNGSPYSVNDFKTLRTFKEIPKNWVGKELVLGFVGRIAFYSNNSDSSLVSRGSQGSSFTIPQNAKYFRLDYQIYAEGKLQLEEGTVATPYEPYIEDKLTILSPVQLEKVGDVADRIIEKDGVWGVEKNVGEQLFDSNSTWTQNSISENYIEFICQNIIPTNIVYGASSSNFIVGANHYNIRTSGSTGKVIIQYKINEAPTLDAVEFTIYIANNPFIIKYVLAQPQFIPLPHDQQVKLRTFANKTNISFLTEIEGTIKAQVPKSLGATVNTHTEQINNLNNELNRVKKLEESTVSTVTTESDFTTVEATSNGYFEDVKLEGKTLVNLLQGAREYTLTRESVESNSTQAMCETYVLDKNKDYTVIYIQISREGHTPKFNIYNAETGEADYYKTNLFDTNTTGYEVVIKKINRSCNWQNMRIYYDNERIGTTKFKLLLLEGDHTQNPPSYFEGLKSVGQSASEDGVDEIVVSSVKGDGNLFDGELDTQVENGVTFSYDSATGEIVLNGTCTQDNTCVYFKHPPKFVVGNTYYLRMFDVTTKSIPISVRIYDDNYIGNILSTTTVGSSKYIPSATKQMVNTSIRIDSGVTLNNFRFKVQLTVNKDNENYTPYQPNKKRLLYYNTETQTWEKPILREWDSIEKHADGKYYYHQRSAEVVLNGSESWSINAIGTVFYNNVRLLNAKTPISNSLSAYIPFLCDRLVPTNIDTIYNNNIVNGIGISKDSNIGVSVDGRELATFKQWLQANNVTVVYQLAEEKVYECTNIDLITYANETNYIVESGVIVPKTTLKVMSNISNVVRELQIKVSTLESYIQYTILNALKNALNE